MRFDTKTIVRFFGVWAAMAPFHRACAADPDDHLTTTNSPAGSDPGYGLFDLLDRRSMYTQEVFPEPFLLDDMAYEDNELELSWLHTKGNGQQNDTGAAELQMGVGLLTLMVEVPYERLVDPDDTVRGIGSIEIGARYPLYQYVSANRFVDATFGVSMEGSLPVHRDVSSNPELEPLAFNDLKLGNNFTIQTILGYSTLLGGTNNDEATGIAADANGSAYVVGWTVSTNFPYTNALSGFISNSLSYVHTNGTGYVVATNGFLTRIDWNGTNANIGYSVMFGGYGVDIANGVAVDPSGNAYVVGSASSTNFPVTITTNDVYDGLSPTNHYYKTYISSDVFVIAFNKLVGVRV